MNEVLSKTERQSAVWAKVEEHLNERLAILRAMNDHSVSPEKTERLRGRIGEVKSLLSLSKEMPEIEEEFPAD